MKIVNRLKKKIIRYIFKKPRILKYDFLSTAEHINGKPKLGQPLQLNGLGIISFADNVTIGIDPSPYLYNTYCYIEARNKHSSIYIGSNTFINNNCTFISEGDGIHISSDCLIGTGCEIYDSDFHNLNPSLRYDIKEVKTAKVILENNVFIGSNVKILKGVTIGENSVIANGSIVTKSIQKNVVAGGIPAQVLRKIQ